MKKRNGEDHQTNFGALVSIYHFQSVIFTS